MKKSIEDRLDQKIVRTGFCWLWTGSKGNKYGHGVISYKGKNTYTHRLMWELTNGPVPEGMCVCHSCDVAACINPSHLWVGTHQDNMRDKEQKGRGNRGPVGPRGPWTEERRENQKRAFEGKIHVRPKWTEERRKRTIKSMRKKQDKQNKQNKGGE